MKITDIFALTTLAALLIGTYVFLSLDRAQSVNEEIEKNINNVKEA